MRVESRNPAEPRQFLSLTIFMLLGIISCFHSQVLLPQSVLSNPLGVKLVPHSGVVGPRKLGDPSDEMQVGTLFLLNISTSTNADDRFP